MNKIYNQPTGTDGVVLLAVGPRRLAWYPPIPWDDLPQLGEVAARATKPAMPALQAPPEVGLAPWANETRRLLRSAWQAAASKATAGGLLAAKRRQGRPEPPRSDAALARFASALLQARLRPHAWYLWALKNVRISGQRLPFMSTITTEGQVYEWGEGCRLGQAQHDVPELWPTPSGRALQLAQVQIRLCVRRRAPLRPAEMHADAARVVTPEEARRLARASAVEAAEMTMAWSRDLDRGVWVW
jgi:hypothetical protein